jgi:hypothetical protein
MDGKGKWKKEKSIQWVIDQLTKSVVQEVKPEGYGNINYDKNLGDKHLVWCSKCNYIYDAVYGDIHPNFPKYGKRRKDHNGKCEKTFTRRN